MISNVLSENFQNTTKRRLEAAPQQNNNFPNDTNVNADKIPLNITGNGIAGFALFFFLWYFVDFMIGFTRKIFVSQQLVRDPLYVGKIDS